MLELNERTIPAAVAELTVDMDQQLQAIERARQMLVSASDGLKGLDSHVRLLFEGTRNLLQGRPAQEGGLAAAGSTDELPAHLAELGRTLVEGVNARAVLPEQAGGGDAAARLVAAVSKLRTTKLEPFRKSLSGALRDLFQVLRYDSSEDREYSAAAKRYAELVGLADGLNAELDEWTGGTQLRRAWTGRVGPLPIDPARLLTVVTVDGRPVPQIDSQAWGDLLSAINQEIASGLRMPEATTDEPVEARIERMDKSFIDLMERALDLIHSVREAAGRKKQSGADVGPGPDIVKELKALLLQLDVEEVEVTPGDRVNERKHKVTGHEPYARFGSGQVVRLVVPGYYYHGEIQRKALVIATP